MLDRESNVNTGFAATEIDREARIFAEIGDADDEDPVAIPW